MTDVTAIAEALIALVAAVVSCLLVPYLRGRVSAQRQGQLAELVRVAVCAAEQLFSGPGRGTEKKQAVLDWLTARGVSVDFDTLDTMIEAAVWELGKAK